MVLIIIMVLMKLLTELLRPITIKIDGGWSRKRPTWWIKRKPKKVQQFTEKPATARYRLLLIIYTELSIIDKHYKKPQNAKCESQKVKCICLVSAGCDIHRTLCVICRVYYYFPSFLKTPPSSASASIDKGLYEFYLRRCPLPLDNRYIWSIFTEETISLSHSIGLDVAAAANCSHTIVILASNNKWWWWQ